MSPGSGTPAPSAREALGSRVRDLQAAVSDRGLQGWLLYDFHGTNPIARRILGFTSLPDPPKTTRRWFYWVPASGTPVKLVHRLEPHALDHLEGRTEIYLTWGELERALAAILRGAARVALEYSPQARLPYVSRVDAGTVELVRAAGAEVVSSADLAQRFDGALDPEARRDHIRTGGVLNGILGATFRRAGEAARAGRPLTEIALQRFILECLAAESLVSGDPPTVAVNEHAGDAHFMNTPELDRPIRTGDLLLLDAWAKGKTPGAVYADYTQMGFLGSAVPDAYRAAFDAVRDARDRAIRFVRDALVKGEAPRGCDVDDAAREVIRSRGFGERFIHRTGHSIGEEVHGNGVHLDNLETRDERRLLDGSLVSVEPGVYFETFGVRSEVNLLIDGDKGVVTTEPVQKEILLL